MSQNATGDSAGQLEQLDEAECLRLISPGGIGRLAYNGRHGLTVSPVNYVLHDGTIVFRTAHDSPTDEDLRTGIADAEYKVAFEIDQIDAAAKEGWSVLVRGSAHHVSTEAERASVLEVDVEPWAGGVRDHSCASSRPALPGAASAARDRLRLITSGCAALRSASGRVGRAESWPRAGRGPSCCRRRLRRAR